MEQMTAKLLEGWQVVDDHYYDVLRFTLSNLYYTSINAEK